MISEKFYFIFMVWRNHSHWIEFGKFSSQFMDNISDLTECNVLFNHEHLILIWFYDTEFDLKITLRILNPENPQVGILMKIC